MNKTVCQKSIDAFRSLFISSAIILIAGIILGAFLVPWELEQPWAILMIIVVMIIFSIGVGIQYRREKNIEWHMNEEISKLKERIEKLEPPIDDENDLILTIGNMDLKITKEGRIQVRAKSGIASVKEKRSSTFTTTSTNWVDVTGMNFDEIQFNSNTPEEEKEELHKAINFLKANKSFLLQLFNSAVNLSKYFS